MGLILSIIPALVSNENGEVLSEPMELLASEAKSLLGKGIMRLKTVLLLGASR
ncbi:hypothetical protein M7I_6890 [Glarea lozoyensis 74030]|uniref:Uncharacterized protein n=1 Tax=Glarea lozoyensis (strain ATCC 74030 / MF5533) TaxID=1104152 RepID=H0EVT4_GLAL7|nr:hypothetical protein M7I_6890 [Glarea lozoyensis 74030]